MQSPAQLAEQDDLLDAFGTLESFAPSPPPKSPPSFQPQVHQLSGIGEEQEEEEENQIQDEADQEGFADLDAVFLADRPARLSAAAQAAHPAERKLVDFLGAEEAFDEGSHRTSSQRPRPSTIGRILFPAPSAGPTIGKARPLRASLPLQSAANHEGATPALRRAKRLSLPVAPSASASLSASGPLETSIQSGSALLTLPLARQLQGQKARARELEEQQIAQAAIHQATAARIKELEEALEKARLEQEGWQAEAQQLAARLEASSNGGATGGTPTAPATPNGTRTAQAGSDDTRIADLERSLALETSKRKRGKELQSKLRCELVNRRWKEKWEVELLEREERQLEIRIVELEARLVLEEYEREMEKLERAEAEDNLAAQVRQVSALTASRQVLLSSFRTSEQTIASLRGELSTTRIELDAATGASDERVRELEAEVGQLEETKRELASVKKEVQRLEKGEKKSEAERNKDFEKERSKREKLEGEVRALKAQLRAAEAAAKAAEKAAKVAAPLSRSSSTIKATPAHLTDSESEQAPVHVPITATPSEHGSENESEPEMPVLSESDQEVADEEACRPTKSKSRSAPAPKPVKAVKSKMSKAPKVLPDVEEPAESAASEDEAPPTPKKAATAQAKKRKADVLGDKSTNARGAGRDDDLTGGVGLKIKKAKKVGAASSSKVSALALALGGGGDDSDEDGVPSKSKKAKKSKHRGADADDDDLPKKTTKKRTLLGPRKKFDWTSEARNSVSMLLITSLTLAWYVQTADINSMIPMDLSPIKKQPAKKTGGILGASFLSGPAGKASFF